MVLVRHESQLRSPCRSDGMDHLKAQGAAGFLWLLRDKRDPGECGLLLGALFVEGHME